MLLTNILLALAWVGLTGELTARNVVIGFGLAWAILWVVRRVLGESRYFARAGHVVELGFYFAWQLVLANLRIAWDIITPGHNRTPGILAIPLDAKTDAQITLLANLITLTPGTLSLDVSPDRRVLYIHALYIDDVDAVRRAIKTGFERRVLEVLS